jgi:hypothetical protein
MSSAPAAKDEEAPREVVGRFARHAPIGRWGGGFFVAHDVTDDGKRAPGNKRYVLQRAFAGEAAALSREAAWRRAHPHALMPRVVDDGLVAAGAEAAHAWIAFEAVVAVPLDRVLAVHPVPIALTWAVELVDVMQHHARVAAQTGHSVELRPSFADLLVTNAGSLLVLTPPSLARSWSSELLRVSRHDGLLRAPELGTIKHEPFATQLDVYAVGALLRLTLRERADDPRRDISTRTARLVERATGALAARHESLDELAHDLRACLDEFPALTTGERAHAVRGVAEKAFAHAEEELA